MRLALIVALGLGVGLFAARTEAASCQAVSASPAASASFERALNATRSSRGAAPLRQNARLRAIAARYACEMARTGRFSHVSASGQSLQQRARAGGYRFCVLGENIAWGQKSLGVLDRGWRRSPGHFSNYVMPRARDYALAGAARIDGGKPGPIYWVMLVGRSGC